jgi:hypothetical protein
MGHEVVLYHEKPAIIHDRDFEASRHFFVIEADERGFLELASFIHGWTYEGPGVWTGEDFDDFFHRDVALERPFVVLLGAAYDRVKGFGDIVPLEYVRANIRGTWTEPPATSDWLKAIDKLRSLFPVLQGEAVAAETVAVVWAADRKRRAEIIHRKEGLLQVLLYREMPGDGEYEPDAYWLPVGRDAILTDSLERAKALANEELRLVDS